MNCAEEESSNRAKKPKSRYQVQTYTRNTRKAGTKKMPNTYTLQSSYHSFECSVKCKQPVASWGEVCAGFLDRRKQIFCTNCFRVLLCEKGIILFGHIAWRGESIFGEKLSPSKRNNRKVR